MTPEFIFPRIGLFLLILFSTIQTLRNPSYRGSLKAIKMIPRIYLLVYYIFLLTGWYIGTGFQHQVITGAGSANGIALVFLADIYTQWANRKYGRS